MVVRILKALKKNITHVQNVDIQTWLVQFTDQKKKVIENWNWPFLISQYWKPPISTLAINLWWSQIRGIICRTIVQFIVQKKAWIGTIAILKGLKNKLSWTSLKSKTQLIQFTDQQTGTLKFWNLGIELSIWHY